MIIKCHASISFLTFGASSFKQERLSIFILKHKPCCRRTWCRQETKAQIDGIVLRVIVVKLPIIPRIMDNFSMQLLKN